MNDDLGWNDGVLCVDEKRLLWRQPPLTAEAFAAVPRAKLPERRVPWGAVSVAASRTGGNQPSLQDLLEEAVLEQPFAVNAAQFLRLENPSPALLQIPKSCQRRGESFVWSGQLEPPILGDACEILRLYRYKSITPSHYKSILPYHYKFIMLD